MRLLSKIRSEMASNATGMCGETSQYWPRIGKAVYYSEMGILKHALIAAAQAGRATALTDGDSFCVDINSTTFIARRAGSGLQFYLGLWNERSRFFGVGATAHPADGSVRYHRRWALNR